jgi:hypothetical protein
MRARIVTILRTRTHIDDVVSAQKYSIVISRIGGASHDEEANLVYFRNYHLSEVSVVTTNCIDILTLLHEYYNLSTNEGEILNSSVVGSC